MPRSAECSPVETLEAKDLQHLLHPVTYYRSYPANGAKVAATASNVYVRDTDGKQYLDGVAGLWCTAIGYGDKELARVAPKNSVFLRCSSGTNSTWMACRTGLSVYRHRLRRQGSLSARVVHGAWRSALFDKLEKSLNETLDWTVRNSA